MKTYGRVKTEDVAGGRRAKGGVLALVGVDDLIRKRALYLYQTKNNVTSSMTLHA